MNGSQVSKSTFCERGPESLCSLGASRLEGLGPPYLKRSQGISEQIIKNLFGTQIG